MSVIPQVEEGNERKQKASQMGRLPMFSREPNVFQAINSFQPLAMCYIGVETPNHHR